jgi:hypothetical protein
MASVQEHLEGNPEDGIRRPVVEISLRLGSKTVPLRALVDSGADQTIIPTQLAEAMTGQSFKELDGEEIVMEGVCGKVPAKVIPATATYGSRTFATRVMVGPTPRVLVGREDFMAAFNARFYWGRKPPVFYVEPADVPSTKPAQSPPTNPTIRPRGKRRRR